jgi:hypothetical protein
VDSHGLDPASLLLDPAFLEDVLAKYSVQPLAGGPPAPAHFALKHLNIVDPLLPSNNLGRSVSKASFARIRRAFAHGAHALATVMRKVGGWVVRSAGCLRIGRVGVHKLVNAKAPPGKFLPSSPSPASPSIFL